MLALLCKKQSIVQQFTLYIVLFSSFITIIITAFQLYRDYNDDIKHINVEFEQIKHIHLNSLSAALWASNTPLLQTNIEGILKTRDVQYVSITDDEKQWVKVGEIKGDNNIERNYAITFHHRSKLINIGKLTVNVSLAGVYQRLMDKVWVILVSNAIKTFFVAVFIAFLFYHFIAKHLLHISRFLKNHDPLINTEHLSIDRGNKNKDEVDAVLEAINGMNARLNAQVLEINQQKQYLFQTLDSIGEAVIATDEAANIVSINPIAEKLIGYKKEDVKNKPLKSIFTVIDTYSRKSIVNSIEQVLTTEQSIYLNYDATLISKTGQEYQISNSVAPIRSDGKILGMVIVFNDVSEQYRKSQNIEQNNILLRKITGRVPGMVYQFVLDPNGEKSFPYMSDGVKELYNLTAEEVCKDANLIFSATHPHDVQLLNDSILESAQKFSPWKLEYRIHDKNGNVRWLYGDATPERMHDGGTLWHGFVTDITEKNETEEHLKQTQKMDVLGKLTGGIAHDYNNMLGVILGYSELLATMIGDKPNLQNYISQITHAGKRGAKLTAKLLTFSRVKSTEVVVADINTLLNDQRHMLEKTLTARIRLELKLQENLWPVYFDEDEFEDTILNMSINAMHAIENSGELSITTSNDTLGSFDADYLNIEAGEYVSVCIHDNGKGIDNETKEKMFDPFFSTKGDKGTGLGLSQVYNFMINCRGSISVDSSLCDGTAFKLYFPKYSGEWAKIDYKKTNDDICLKGSEKILVVDDEPALLELTCELLQQQGYSVYRALNAVEGLNILEVESIDLLISDVIMPYIDGYTFAATVKNRFPQVKIQLVSGYTGEKDSQSDNELTQNLIKKPYKRSFLLKKVRALLM